MRMRKIFIFTHSDRRRGEREPLLQNDEDLDWLVGAYIIIIPWTNE